MQKVYTRKRSKPIKNPFQSDNRSLLTNLRFIIPVLTFLALLLTYSVLTTIIDSNDGQHQNHHHHHRLNDESSDSGHHEMKKQINPNSSSRGSFVEKTRKSFFKPARKQKVIPSSNYVYPLSSFKDEKDPNLHTMTFTLPSQHSNDEQEKRTFEAYVQPHISSFYNKNDLSMKQVKPSFRGEAGKFINLSNRHLTLYWGPRSPRQYIAHLPPFQAVGTATFPGHIFVLTPKDDPNEVIHTINVIPNESLYVYDPYYDEEKNKVMIYLLEDELKSKEERDAYWLQRNNLEFGKQYYEFTGREWLSLYPLKKQPSYRMWNADYFGQEHWIVTKEKQFMEEPPAHLLGGLSHDEFHQDVLEKNRHLTSYRHNGDDDNQYFNMTLKVLSCAPRVFEIKNFLSPVEVDHIVHMATGMKLSLSTTSGSDGSDRRSDSKTRTSKNSWVDRNRSPIIDSIYRRAADLMQIDEALLRRRDKGERPDIDHLGTSAEHLQLVHYDVSEQYTAHHDFSYPSTHRTEQPVRFATLLLYLNEGMRGGETSFPRWVNAETSKKLSVVPEIGKAVLFYSMMPDGNMDDLSQHAAEPVIDGEKWLINLWTWDPVFR